MHIQGDVGEELYLIKRGLFEVLNDDETVHRMLGAGSYFGEIALLCQVHRTMTVRAVSHGLLFVIEKSQFMHLMVEYRGSHNICPAAHRPAAHSIQCPQHPMPTASNAQCPLPNAH